jgi:hypothetical protein
MAVLLRWLLGWDEVEPALSHGRGGGITVHPELWRVDRDNRRIDDLTDALVAWVVEWQGSRGAAAQMTAEIVLRDPQRLHPLRDYVAPWLRLTYDDGRPAVAMQLGLYVVSLPEETHWLGHSEARYEGRDLTWLLANSILTRTHNVKAGTRLETALGRLTRDAGLRRFRYRTGTRAVGRDRSFPPGTTRLAAINDLATGTGHYAVAADRDGTLYTMAYRSLADVEPWATFTADDPVDVVTVTPDSADRVANVVVVKKEHPTEAPIVAIRRNDDPTSPTSTVTLGRDILYGGAPVVDGELETQADAEALADELLRLAGSYYRTVTLRLLPMTPPGTREVVELRDFRVGSGDLSGRYWVRSWRLGAVPEEAVLELTMDVLTYYGGTVGE